MLQKSNPKSRIQHIEDKMNLWQRAKKINSRINTFFVLIAGCCIFFPVFSITADVVMRYCFNKPIPGMTEIVTMAVVLMIYLSLGYSFAEGGFVKVEMLVRFFPPKIRLIVEFFTLMIFLFIFGLIFWQATKFAMVSTLKREYVWGLINIPLYPSKWAVAVGFLLVMLQGLIHFGDVLIALFTKTNGEKP